MTIRLTVNGVGFELPDSRGQDTLLDFLHEELNLTGTKLCCGIGVCRACTVQVVKPPSPAPVPTISCSTALATRSSRTSHSISCVSWSTVSRWWPTSWRMLNRVRPGLALRATTMERDWWT